MEPIEAKKSLGQHWLNDSASLEAMCDAAGVQADDVVLEIGPGQGTLTEHLIGRQAEVVAIEYDESLIPGLQQKFGHLPSTRFWVEHSDIRTYDLGGMPDRYKIVANIPYYLTANLLRILTEATHKPVVAALLVQKEVAERVAAQPGALSLISVIVQLEYQVSLGQVVPARLFAPPPKVDSQILVLKKHQRPLWDDVDHKQLHRLLKAGFSNRRKTLHNSLSAGLRMPKEQVGQVLNSAGINPMSRPQELSLDNWHRLYQSFNE